MIFWELVFGKLIVFICYKILFRNFVFFINWWFFGIEDDGDFNRCFVCMFMVLVVLYLFFCIYDKRFVFVNYMIYEWEKGIYLYWVSFVVFRVV